MSLLEDIYAEEDDRGNDLERIIEGDDLENNEVRSDESDDGGNKSDEAEEDRRRIDPKEPKQKRVSKNPRFVLNPARLTGPRGIQTIQKHFKDFKFKGKGHEQEDLDVMLKKLEHWAHRLYPKFQFDDCLEKIEMLGRKRQVMTHVKKIRQDLLDSDAPAAQYNSSEDEAAVAAEPPPMDEFDQLLEQQIAIARSTPASVRPESKKAEKTSKADHGNITPGGNMANTFAFTPSNSTLASNISTSINKLNSASGLTEEQKERILLNRQLAEQKRLERIKLQQTTSHDTLLQKVQDTSQPQECEKSKLFNEKDILKSMAANKSSDELHCTPNEVDTDTLNIGKDRSGNARHIETVTNEELEVIGDKEMSFLDVDHLENHSNRKDIDENLNGIEMESSNESEENIVKKMTEGFSDEELTMNLNDEDVNAIEIEKDSFGDIIKDSNGIEIISGEEDLKKQRTGTVEELGDSEMSMSLQYNDENFTNEL